LHELVASDLAARVPDPEHVERIGDGAGCARESGRVPSAPVGEPRHEQRRGREHEQHHECERHPVERRGALLMDDDGTEAEASTEWRMSVHLPTVGRWGKAPVRAPVYVRRMLALEELRADVESGAVDTVIAAFTDMQGRLMGKRLDAE